jgi:hypothetical protein
VSGNDLLGRLPRFVWTVSFHLKINRKFASNWITTAMIFQLRIWLLWEMSLRKLW